MQYITKKIYPKKNLYQRSGGHIRITPSRRHGTGSYSPVEDPGDGTQAAGLRFHAHGLRSVPLDAAKREDPR